MGKGNGMCSQCPCMCCRVGFSCSLDSHGGTAMETIFLPIFSPSLCWATAKILQPGPSPWRAALGAVIPQISHSLLIGNISWQNMEFFSEWLAGLEKSSLDKSCCPSELQGTPKPVSSGPPMLHQPFYAAERGIFGAEARQRNFLSFVKALRTFGLPE